MTQRNISELNLNYLILAKELLQEDFDSALVQLHIDEPLGLLIRSMSSKSMAILASSNQLLVKMALVDVEPLKRILNNDDDKGLAQTKVASLLASIEMQTIDELVD